MQSHMRIIVNKYLGWTLFTGAFPVAFGARSVVNITQRTGSGVLPRGTPPTARNYTVTVGT